MVLQLKKWLLDEVVGEEAHSDYAQQVKRNDTYQGRDNDKSSQDRNQLPADKQHQERPHQVELLLQREGPVVTDHRVIETDRPGIPKMMIVESESCGGDDGSIRYRDPPQVRQRQNHKDVEVKTREDSQHTADVGLLPVEFLSLLYPRELRE